MDCTGARGIIVALDGDDTEVFGAEAQPTITSIISRLIRMRKNEATIVSLWRYICSFLVNSKCSNRRKQLDIICNKRYLASSQQATRIW